MPYIELISIHAFQRHARLYQPILDITVPNKISYIQRHNYIGHIYDYVDPNYTGFTKLKHCKKVMVENHDLDWIVWVDSDAIITNFTKRLEDFIPEDDTEFIIGEDWNGFNVGVFFLKNNERTIHFLETLLNFQPSKEEKQQYVQWWVESEQHAMFQLRNMVNTKVVHHTLFNSYLINPNTTNDWRPRVPGPLDPNWKYKKFEKGDFALHAAGQNMNDKLQTLSQGLSMVVK